jgi:hypothetical protein
MTIATSGRGSIEFDASGSVEISNGKENSPDFGSTNSLRERVYQISQSRVNERGDRFLADQSVRTLKLWKNAWRFPEKATLKIARVWYIATDTGRIPSGHFPFAGYSEMPGPSAAAADFSPPE